MAKITYIEHNGTEHVVDVANGLTVMEGARAQWIRTQGRIRGIDIPGIKAQHEQTDQAARKKQHNEQPRRREQVVSLRQGGQSPFADRQIG